jgi:hypothetical protein
MTAGFTDEIDRLLDPAQGHLSEAHLT